MKMLKAILVGLLLFELMMSTLAMGFLFSYQLHLDGKMNCETIKFRKPFVWRMYPARFGCEMGKLWEGK